jgi:hypothetical protein
MDVLGHNPRLKDPSSMPLGLLAEKAAQEISCLPVNEWVTLQRRPGQMRVQANGHESNLRLSLPIDEIQFVRTGVFHCASALQDALAPSGDLVPSLLDDNLSLIW